MKKISMIAATLLIACSAASCGDDKNDKPKTTFEAAITLTEALPSELIYGEPVAFKATVTTDNTLTGGTLRAVGGG